MARIEPGELFPSVSNSIDSTIIFWTWLFGLLAGSSPAGWQNEFGAVNPLILFSLGFVGLGFVMFREANNLDQFKEVLGVDVSIPGYGIFLTIAGLGFGFVMYGVFTKELLTIAGSAAIASVANPFYNPVTASASSFTFSLRELGSQLLLHTYVGVFEETYKVVMFKNIANSIHRYGREYRFVPALSIVAILVISLFLALFLWTMWHFFSWSGLTLSSIVWGMIYGLAFMVVYFVAAAANIIEPDTLENKEIANALGGAIIYPNIGTHISWNVLVGLGGLGLSGMEYVLYGSGIVVIAFGAMVGLKSSFGSALKID